MFETEEMAGQTKGTPVSSKDGSIIVTTYNHDDVQGYFAVFNYGVPEANLTFAAPTTKSDSGMNSSYPFGSVGYCYEPMSGCYLGGENNKNDLFMWSADTPSTAMEAGFGRLFAFQVPIWNPWNITKPKVAILGNSTMFQTLNPPVFANKCYSMYMATTRSEIRYWSSTGKPRDYFDKPSTKSFEWGRGSPRFIAASAPPTLSSDPVKPVIYGPSAAAQLYRMSYDLSDVKNVTTPSPLTNKVLLSPDDLYVYYSNSGSLFQLDATNLKMMWNVTVGDGAAVFGEIAQSIDGAYIYIANSFGSLFAIQVKKSSLPAESTAPTASPTETSDVATETAAPTTPAIEPRSSGAPASPSDQAPMGGPPADTAAKPSLNPSLAPIRKPTSGSSVHADRLQSVGIAVVALMTAWNLA